jgi:outer membrane protein TolC
MFPYRAIHLVSTFLSLLALGGCTTHYKQSLRDFEAGKTSSFYQRTLDWTAREESVPTTGTRTIVPPAPPPSVSAEAKESSPEEVSFRLVEKVLGLKPDELKKQADRMKQPADLDRVVERQLTLSDLQLAVALHNPEVRAMRASWEAALQQYAQADYLEGLIAQFRTFTRYLNVEPGEPLNKQMQPVYSPYPGVTAFKSEMIGAMVRMADLEWQRGIRDKAFEAGKQYFEYLYLKQAQVTTRENIQLLEDLARNIEERYRTGQVNQANVLKVRNDLARQKSAQADLESRERTVRAALNALMGRAPEAALGQPVETNLRAPEPTESFWKSVTQNRQEIGTQRAEIVRLQAAIRMGEVMNRPPASQGYSAFERGMMPESQAGQAAMGDNASTKTGMGPEKGSSGSETGPPFGLKPREEKPRLGFAQAEAYLAESRRRLEAENLKLDNLIRQTRAEGVAVFEEIHTARRKVELIKKTTLPAAQTTYEISQSEYTSGGSSFLDLLDAERDLIETRLMAHEARRDLNQAVLRLGTISGKVPR